MTIINTDATTVNKIWVKNKRNLCSVETVQKRFPIVKWLPRYAFMTLIQDIIAGVTVGLTAVPQGIAYAVVAGLSPEYGLYSCMMAGLVYPIFGSSKDLTVGPTAILSAIVAKYVAGYSLDFAVLAAFMTGVIVLLMGLLRLSFLVDFISATVISGFTTAAALQIISGQLRSLFGYYGPSGNYFSESIYYFIKNVATSTLWDTVLGIISIGILIFLKKVGQGCSRTDGFVKQLTWFISLGRNAVVIILGMIITFVIKNTTDGTEPIAVIGTVASGMPHFGLPLFTTIIGNQTYEFPDMLRTLGPQSVVIPLVAILEIVAITKAFAGGKSVDATQELIALGLCNILGSFIKSMPVTGSFTRTSINNASGVQTTLGSVFTSLLIILALTLLTDAFYYIPKSALAALIIAALFQMVDILIFCRLWRSSKKELAVLVITIAFSLGLGLEYGIVSGILADAFVLLYVTAKPSIKKIQVKNETRETVTITLNGSLLYCAAEHLRRKIINSGGEPNSLIVIDGSNLYTMDSTIARILVNSLKDLKSNGNEVIFLNFKNNLQKLCIEIFPQAAGSFVTATKLEDCFRAELCRLCVE